MQSLMILSHDNSSVSRDNPLPITAAQRTDAWEVQYYTTSVTTATSIKTGTAGKCLYITDVIISNGTAADVRLQTEEAGPNVILGPFLMANTSTVSHRFVTPLKVPSGKSIYLWASTASKVSVYLAGYLQ